MEKWKNKIYNLFADLGDWLNRAAKDKENAIILAVLCLLTPLNIYLL